MANQQSNGETYIQVHRLRSSLTFLCIVPAAAIAANVLDLFPNVTVDHEGHIVVVVMVGLFFFIIVNGHHSGQVKCLLLRFLHRHGRVVLPVSRGKPTPMLHDGGRGIRHGIVGRLEHRDAKKNGSASKCTAYGKGVLNPNQRVFG